jgi:hypothetical protein
MACKAIWQHLLKCTLLQLPAADEVFLRNIHMSYEREVTRKPFAIFDAMRHTFMAGDAAALFCMLGAVSCYMHVSAAGHC